MSVFLVRVLAYYKVMWSYTINRYVAVFLFCVYEIGLFVWAPAALYLSWGPLEIVIILLWEFMQGFALD